MFRSKDGERNELDSIVNGKIIYSSQMNLFRLSLDDISSVMDDEWTKKSPMTIFPNPVHKDGEINVISQKVGKYVISYIR
ncbi:MAG: hypothetical protein IPP49_14085 [Saprospiraceae bacterium]|nr:hypothetical protein [Saprospiraceae bacterium]